MNRNLTTKIAFVLDQILPPILRDQKWFMWPLFRILFDQKSAKMFMEFKIRAPFFKDGDFDNWYCTLKKAHIQRPTDLNDDCLKHIIKNIVGKKILDIACGRGYLLKCIAQEKSRQCYGVDLDISAEFTEENIIWQKGHVNFIPFEDKAFDTVICTHTLEHILDIEGAIRELRRVCRKRLIIVVPKQREYKYTFDLHLHFFPYLSSFLKFMRNKEAICHDDFTDIYYQEDL